MIKKPIIEVSHLSIAFQDKKVIDNISLELEENKIYGLLGKNGIGKSTLINTIVGGLQPKDGEIKIDGVNPYKDATILEKVCVVREQEFLQPDMKVKDIFAIYQIFFPHYDKKLQEKLVKFFELPIKKSYRTYSRGMKTLVTNIIGLCSNAPITLFDEPTIGLDAVNRTQFYEILLDVYSKKPRTIILSTHQIDEVENLLEHIIMLDKGKVIIDENIEEVRNKAYILKGRKEALEKLDVVQNKAPKSGLGNMQFYTCYGLLSDDDMKRIKDMTIEKEPMTLQQLFIYLTKEKELDL